MQAALSEAAAAAAGHRGDLGESGSSLCLVPLRFSAQYKHSFSSLSVAKDACVILCACLF